MDFYARTNVTTTHCTTHPIKSNTRRAPGTVGHTTRGNVLWTVWEITRLDGDRVRYIGCDLLSHEKGYGWGYTDMEESMYPYYTLRGEELRFCKKLKA